MATVRRLLVVVAVLATLCDLKVDAWGPLGHKTIAGTASKLMGPASLKRLQAVLKEGETIEDAAVWPDGVREQAKTFKCFIGNLINDKKIQAVCDMVKWSRKLHFVSRNTDLATCDFDYSRDCKEDACAVGAIQNYTSRLEERGPLVDEEQRIYTRMLLHIVGDIHQPLHVGFEQDRGGNNIEGKFMGTSVNLHDMWDDNLIEQHIQQDFSGNADKWKESLLLAVQKGGKWEKNVQEWTQCEGAINCPRDWAEQNGKIACQYAYKNEQGATGEPIKGGFQLGKPYLDHVKEIVDQQIAKAAVRLAHTMDKIFEHAAKPKPGGISSAADAAAMLMDQQK